MWFNLRNLSTVPVNFCDGCQDKMCDESMEDPTVQRFHWCHRCGVLRSDDYHNENPLPDTELRPNYCDECTEEILDLQVRPEFSDMPYGGSRKGKASFFEMPLLGRQ
jgi:hypothetical protein